MTTEHKPLRRRGRSPAAHLARHALPYAMTLADGRTLYVEIPGRWTAHDKAHGVALLPEAVRFLDRVRAMAVRLNRAPSPGYITALREALGLTQAQLGERLGVDKMTVARWEWGKAHPSATRLAALERVRQAAARSGIIIGGHEGLVRGTRKRKGA